MKRNSENQRAGKIIIVTILLTIVCLIPLKMKEKKTKCWNDINLKKIEKHLKENSIKAKVPFYEYYKEQKLLKGRTEEEVLHSKSYIRKKNLHETRPIFVVIYNNGLKAIAKIKHRYELQSSVSAYRISQVLDLKIVPPTIIREIDGRSAIFQMFVENVHKDKKDYLDNLNPVQKSDIYIYIFVTGVMDINFGNILISKKCSKPVLVDNDYMAITLDRYGNPPPFNISVHEPHPFLSQRDYENPPFEEAVELTIPSFIQFLNQKIIPDLQESGLGSPNLFLQIKKDMDIWPPIDGSSISWLKYKGTYWVTTTKWYKELLVSRHLLPIEKIKDFSPKTLKKLRKITYKELKRLLIGNYKDSRTFINGVLYRRDMILKEVEKMRTKEKQLKQGHPYK